jgi:prepilin-type N-terminal cleavage/methylation domain-containing protein
MFSNKKAFTLIELLVVVLIIGILAAIALPQYNKAVLRSRAAEAVQLQRSLYNAEQMYFLANGVYTTDVRKLDITYNGTVTGACDDIIGNGCTLTSPHFYTFVWFQPSSKALTFETLFANGLHLILHNGLNGNKTNCYAGGGSENETKVKLCLDAGFTKKEGFVYMYP